MEITSFIAKHSTSDFTFQKHCESFVQPEMLVVCICDQVASPAVRNFMRDNSC